MSTTCQLMTAAISTGLPTASLTFSVSLSRLRTRSEKLRRTVNGLTQRRPSWRIVPM